MSDAATPATISASVPSCMPAPDQERRDNLGRLTSLAWFGGQTRAATTSTRWLVAVDGSACSLRAVTAAAHLVAMGQGDVLDLVNVQPWLSKEAAESELVRRGWAATAPARQLLQASATPWRLHVLMGEDATSIVNLAESLDSLGICIGSHGWTAAEAVLLGSVACKVLRLAKVPVLIVR